jgi:K+-transporting ATPase KdpF subunit
VAAIVCKEGHMALEYVIGIIVSFLIMGYLIYALLWPEKF